MTPILLKFKGIGPYKEEQIIDFKNFSGNQVFLISGETGSGKTYILDAILQALYGESTSNDRNDLKDMRCQYMADNEKTYIEFVFELKGKTYQFSRELKKINKRDKSVEYDTICDAKFLNDNCEFVSFFDNPKKVEVKSKAEELIGLDAGQFKQVIILPQGKFEGFLVADTENKEKILSTLFGTDKWVNIVKNVGKISVEKKAQYDKTKAEIELKTNSLNLNDDEKISDLINRKEEELTEIAGQLSSLSQKYNDVEERFKKERDLIKSFDKLKNTELDLEKLQRNSEEIESERLELKKIDSAAKVEPFKQVYSHIKTAFVAGSDSYRQKEKDKINADEEYKKINAKYQELKSKEQEINDKENEFKRNEKTLEDLNKNWSLLVEKQNKEKANVVLKKEILSLENEVAEIDRMLDKKEADKKEAFENGVKQIQVLQEEKNKYALVSDKNNQISKLESKIEVAKKAKSKNEEELRSLAECGTDSVLYGKLFEVVQKSLLNEVSKNLKDNEPCPVCANTTHVKTFKGDSGFDKASEDFIKYIKEKDAKLLKLNSDNNALDKDILDAELDKKKLKQEILTTLSKEYSEQDFNLVKSLLQKAIEKANSIDTLESEINKLNADKKKKEKEKSDKNLELEKNESVIKEQDKLIGGFNEEELKQKIMTLESRNNALKKEINNYNTEKEEIAKRLHTLEGLIEELNNGLKELKEKLLKDKQELDTSKKEYLDALDNSKLTEVDYERVSKKIAQKDEISQKVNKFDLDKNSLISIINDLNKEIGDVDVPAIDIVKTRKEKESIEKERDTLNSNRTLLKADIEKYKNLSKELGSLQTKAEKEQNEYLEADSFYKELNGQSGISLHNYVLSRLLTNITKEANVLLSGVDNGRYSLLVSDEKIGKQRKFGLNLFVYDTYSGKTRSVNTLSGGEKFLVSLSLCLGLSAVISSCSGGIRMETIFIDEGFGSLSDYALNDALKILSTMTASRSLVGIISHVERLKENIHAKLLVKKSINGSVAKIEI